MIPKVSIIMATYNRAHFIIETVQSIQKQSFQNWECLIIDDGSTDNTLETITPILNSDSRFKFLKRTENYKKGLPGSRNYGLDLAKGNYIVFFDDDDVVHPNLLSIGLESLNQKNKDFVLYKKKPFEIDIPLFEDKPIEYLYNIDDNNIYDIVTHKLGIASCTVLWSRNCFEKNRFEQNLMYAEEWECYTRIILQNYKGIFINNILYFNRKHQESNTGQFYNNDPVRVQSKVDAIISVVSNLKKYGKLNNREIQYFLKISVNYKKYKLHYQVINVINKYKMKWFVFYYYYNFRFFLYRLVNNKRKIK